MVIVSSDEQDAISLFSNFLYDFVKDAEIFKQSLPARASRCEPYHGLNSLYLVKGGVGARWSSGPLPSTDTSDQSGPCLPGVVCALSILPDAGSLGH